MNLLTVTQFAAALAKRRRRPQGYTRGYIHLLIQQKRINPAPIRLGDGPRAIYLIDPKALNNLQLGT